MRFFAIIFSTYLVVTSCFPCIEVDADCKNQIEKTADSHKSESSDVCSPLCVCGCCTGTIFEIIKNSCDIIIQDAITFQSQYLQTEPDSPLSSIWQPPKIS